MYLFIAFKNIYLKMNNTLKVTSVLILIAGMCPLCNIGGGGGGGGGPPWAVPHVKKKKQLIYIT